MATRFYLPPSRTATTAPAFDSLWDVTTDVGRGRCYRAASRSNSNAVTHTQSEFSATSELDCLVRQYVSDPLDGAQTISGTVKGQMRAREVNSAANAHTQLVARVVSYDGSTVRGTLYAGDQRTGIVNELTTTIRNQQVPAASATNATSGVATISSVDASDGDRIVIEIGGRFSNTTTTTQTIEYACYDGSGSDLIAGGTETTANNGWIEFSSDLTFRAPILAEDFTEDFAALDTSVWRVEGTPTVTSGALILGASGSVQTYDLFDLRNSTAVVHLTEVPSGGTTAFSFGLCKTPTVYDVIAWELVGESGTVTMKANFWINTQQNFTSQTFDLASHAWLRLRADSTNMHWEYGPDGESWTTFRTVVLDAMDHPDENFFRIFGEKSGATGDWNVAAINPTGGTSAEVTPVTVAAATTVPAPTIPAGATAAPGVVEVTTAVPGGLPSVDAGIAPPVVAAAAAIAPPAPSGGATLTPAALACPVAVPAPFLHTDADVTPASVAARGAVPAPTVVVSSSATVAPGALTATVAVPDPEVAVPTLAADVVPVVTAIGAPEVSTGSTVAPSTPVTAVVAIPGPGAGTGADVAPTALQAAAQVPPPDVTTAAGPTPAVVTIAATIDAPAISTGVTLAPDATRVAAGIPAPGASVGGVAVQPPAVLVACYVPGPGVAGALAPPILTGAITCDRLTATMTIARLRASLTRA